VSAPLQHQDQVLSAAFSPDGRRVVTASSDRTARVWEAASGKPVGAPLQHQGLVLSAAFSPDGRRVVTASDDSTARVWEADTGKSLGAPLEHQDRVTSAAFSPDGRRVVTASKDSTARVWDVLLQCCSSRADAERLATLAEIVAGVEVSDTGALAPVDFDRRKRMTELVRSVNASAPRLTVDWLIIEFAGRFHIGSR
jgi:WD40 repeat protein